MVFLWPYFSVFIYLNVSLFHLLPLNILSLDTEFQNASFILSAHSWYHCTGSGFSVVVDSSAVCLTASHLLLPLWLSLRFVFVFIFWHFCYWVSQCGPHSNVHGCSRFMMAKSVVINIGFMVSEQLMLSIWC